MAPPTEGDQEGQGVYWRLVALERAVAELATSNRQLAEMFLRKDLYEERHKALDSRVTNLEGRFSRITAAIVTIASTIVAALVISYLVGKGTL